MCSRRFSAGEEVREKTKVGNTYTQLYYHFIWATRERQPLITSAMEPQLFRYIRHKCESLRVFVHAVNGMPDHLHIACTLPTTLAIADFLETIKGSSSHLINHLSDADLELYWQGGYGALTFAKHDLPQVVRYIDNQRHHHREGSLSPQMERITEESDPVQSGRR